MVICCNIQHYLNEFFPFQVFINLKTYSEFQNSIPYEMIFACKLEQNLNEDRATPPCYPNQP